MRNLRVIWTVIVCFLLAGCITSQTSVSKEKLREEIAQTSPGEIHITPEISEEGTSTVKLLKRRRPYNIFGWLLKEEPHLPDETKEKIAVPKKGKEVVEEEVVKEELPVIIAKKEPTVEKKIVLPKVEEKREVVNEKVKEETPVISGYLPAIEMWDGECLIYEVSWNSIDIGKGLLVCKDVKNSFGDVYHILGLTIPQRSIMGASLNLFRMDAYLDKKTLQPCYYYQYSKGDDEKEDILEIRFDWKNKKYFTKYRKYNKGKLYSIKEKTLNLPEGAYDTISVFYILRTLDLDKKSSFTIPIAMREIWDLNIQSIGKRTVNIPSKGKGDVYVLKPQAKSSEGFFTKGAMDLWLTADNKRIPVYLEGRVTLGKARMSLMIEKKLPPGAVLNAETITNIISECN
ncbi:MAG: DUF3108 domain-containing protein [bacterium]|nr:DUF3108 domain-containing protein [bacterium]